MASERIHTTTIRARAAFVLAVAEDVFAVIRIGRDLAREALNAGWEWEEKGNGTGDSLYDFFENPEEEGLWRYESQAPEEEKNAWTTLTSAMCYVTWHAYRTDGAKSMPTPIEEVSEDVVAQTVEVARKIPCFREERVDRIEEFLNSNCQAARPEDLGTGIRRNLILDIGAGEQRRGSSR